MMNYVATSIVACMTNILRGKASSLGKLNMSTQAGWFPQFMGQRYNINILIVVILMLGNVLLSENIPNRAMRLPYSR